MPRLLGDYTHSTTNSAHQVHEAPVVPWPAQVPQGLTATLLSTKGQATARSIVGGGKVEAGVDTSASSTFHKMT